jgi:polyhydroxyalkanoate synthesis regulator phasin
MENMLKKALYTGVGLVTIATEKVQETVSGLVDNGKLSEEEGKKVVDDLIADLESKRSDFEGRLNSLVNKIVNTVDLPSRSDFATLKARIKDLEAQLEDGETTASVKKVVKKAVAKKVIAKKTLSTKEA